MCIICLFTHLQSVGSFINGNSAGTFIEGNSISSDDTTPRWFKYLLENLKVTTLTYSIVEHYWNIYGQLLKSISWCERRFHNESDQVHNVPFTPCGKITIGNVMPVVAKTAWKIKVNHFFNVLLNFTRFSVDASVEGCRQSSLR